MKEGPPISAKEKVVVAGASGTMGYGIAKNLLENGFDVIAPIHKTPLPPKLIELGVTAERTPKKAVETGGVSACFEITVNKRSSRAVWLGPNGIVAGSSPEQNQLLIMHSTNPPTLVREVARACEEKGLDFVNAPLTGGKAGADNGTLTIFAAGKKDVLARANKYFDAISTKVIEVGEDVVSATILKVGFNAERVAEMNIVIDILKMAAGAGLDVRSFAGVVGEVFGSMADRLAKFHEDQPVGFRLGLAREVVDYAIESAREYAEDTSMPWLYAARRRLKEQERAGYGSKDWTSVLANTDLTKNN